MVLPILIVFYFCGENVLWILTATVAMTCIGMGGSKDFRWIPHSRCQFPGDLGHAELFPRLFVPVAILDPQNVQKHLLLSVEGV